MANNPAAFNAIIAQIQANTIAIVDLNNAGISTVDLDTLVNALLNNTSVTDVRLDGNNFGANGIPAILKLLQANTPFTALSLATNNLGDASISIIANGLRSNTHLQVIILSSNGVVAKGANDLIDVVDGHPSLNSIWLGNNAIGDQPAIRLASLPNVTGAILHDCGISAAGTTTIFEVVSKGVLTALVLDGNQFTLAGIQILADALSKGANLQWLALSNFGLGDRGLALLIPHLGKSGTIRYFYAHSNGFSEGVIAELAYAWQLNYAIIDVALYNNNGPGNLLMINEIVARNQQYPRLVTKYPIKINQGDIITITSIHLQGSSPRSSSTLQYTVTNVQNGIFLVDERPANQFTQALIDAGRVKFRHGGSKFAPSFQIQLSDGTYPTQWQQSVIRFIPYVGDIVLQKGEFNITRGGVTTLTRNNLLATLGNSTNAAPDLVFNFNTTGCYIQLVPSPLLAQYGLPLEPQRVTSCPQLLVLAGAVQVVHDGSDVVPQVLVSASDGGPFSNPAQMNITFNSASSTIMPSSSPAPTGATTSLMSSTTTSAAASASTSTTVAPASTTRAVSTVTTLPLTSTGSSTTIAPTSTTGAVSTTPATAVVSASSATDSTARALGAAGLAIGLATMVGLIIAGWWLRQRTERHVLPAVGQPRRLQLAPAPHVVLDMATADTNVDDLQAQHQQQQIHMQNLRQRPPAQPAVHQSAMAQENPPPYERAGWRANVPNGTYQTPEQQQLGNRHDHVYDRIDRPQ